MEPNSVSFKSKKWIDKRVEMKMNKQNRGKMSKEQKAILNDPHNKANLCKNQFF